MSRRVMRVPDCRSETGLPRDASVSFVSQAAELETYVSGRRVSIHEGHFVGAPDGWSRCVPLSEARATRVRPRADDRGRGTFET
jgi:hypothetical protein